MSDRQRFADEGVFGRRYEHDDRTVLVADFGAGTGGSVDLVGDTAIVVFDDEQYEFAVPEGVRASASMNNGVLTIEVEHEDEDTDSDDDSDAGFDSDVEVEP
jgi:hypothetical protein